MAKFFVNKANTVHVLGRGGEWVSMDRPPYKVSPKLLVRIPRSGNALKNMEDFFFQVLKIRDDRATRKTVCVLSRAGITPEMLCLIKISGLCKDQYVRQFGLKSAGLLENAIRDYK